MDTPCAAKSHHTFPLLNTPTSPLGDQTVLFIDIFKLHELTSLCCIKARRTKELFKSMSLSKWKVSFWNLVSCHRNSKLQQIPRLNCNYCTGTAGGLHCEIGSSKYCIWFQSIRGHVLLVISPCPPGLSKSPWSLQGSSLCVVMFKTGLF
jgi:hypothetical protein